ncbi:type I restriction enzyme HsdR N-terminal domain-containing protein [Porphyromonas sp.]|uniref:type I restriction enzyme HsdR N-terminal domain-containing protein n=1 Tax=Porphyromonas sp. TaxID=1924944 RepID=UPI0026DD7FAA|nr:type I restriction enzyme HsdR N-terminal domain-containing protein [Porphyromonas sp.]MDO4771236.1 type I restriction enzyme HsdR N-terminal domain-containing protein [Porphyromonas sp.]
MKQDAGADKTPRETIFDPLRQKHVAHTPEEGVRQFFVRYLIEQLGYPAGLMANEFSIKVGKLEKRCDTVVFDKRLQPVMVIEYKAPHIKLTQAVIDQVFRYNSVLRVPYIVITNGAQIGVFHVGYDGAVTQQLPHLPTCSALLGL